VPSQGHIAVSVTPKAREAMRSLAVAATTAVEVKVSMSDAVIAALAVVRQHPDELRAALSGYAPTDWST
jgi:hypothetical protein